jgi:hypothetical protein
MVEKAGRVSGKLLGFLGRMGQDEAVEKAMLRRKRAEAWRGISNTEFAKLFIQRCKEIREGAYLQISNMALGDLEQIEDRKLAQRLRVMQQRIIVIDGLLNDFIPSQQEIEGLLEITEEDEE